MEFFNVGKIVNTHGIKGEVKVVRITDFDQRFKPGNELYLFLPNQTEPIKLAIEKHRKHKQFDMILFKGFYSINEVEHFKQGTLKITAADQHPLEEGSYYYHEIIGCEVETTAGEPLGTITEVLAPGANDVWVVKQKNKKDLLIPYIDDIVKTVNIEKKLVTIEPMEGLLS